jgi:hypothetical protein
LYPWTLLYFSDANCQHFLNGSNGVMGLCNGGGLFAQWNPPTPSPWPIPPSPPVPPQGEVNQLSVYPEGDSTCDEESTPETWYFTSDACFAPPFPFNETAKSMLISTNLRNSGWIVELFEDNQCVRMITSPIPQAGLGTICTSFGDAAFKITLPLEANAKIFQYTDPNCAADSLVTLYGAPPNTCVLSVNPNDPNGQSSMFSLPPNPQNQTMYPWTLLYFSDANCLHFTNGSNGVMGECNGCRSSYFFLFHQWLYWYPADSLCW